MKSTAGHEDGAAGACSEARARRLLEQMTLEEKAAMIHGAANFATAPVPRLGIPALEMSDGPHGVREEIDRSVWRPAGRTDDFVTCLPSGVALASTWNRELAAEFGRVLGAEARGRGKDVILGPGINIHRTPLCGRNFEYFGEDPYLAAQLVVPLICGIQAQGVAACAKHFVANNQEHHRHTIDVEMDERTLREIYLPGFEAAVCEAGVLAVMGAYNKLRGQHCCHNEYLLNDILKGEWKFQGVTISDWNGTHDTCEAACNGLDIEMGTFLGDARFDEYYMAQPLVAAIKRGELPADALDDKVLRILRLTATLGMTELRPGGERPAGAVNLPEHQQTALRIAEESIVLLKNESNLLPFDLGALKSLAVIGANAMRKHAHGGGSSMIKALYEVTPLEGILQRAGSQLRIAYARGYAVDGATDDLIARAVEAASSAEVVVIFGGLNHDKHQDSEGTDRRDMRLPYGQDELIEAVVKANPRTVVVLIGGGPVELGGWLEHTPSLVQMGYAGMEAGNAAARILFGDVTPSGKLTFTWPRTLADSPAHASGTYPGQDGRVQYKEGLMVGYRHFDSRGIRPAFCFGHGLSYTAFEYGELTLRADPPNGGLVTAEVSVTNTGSRPGAEVVQLYVADHEASVPRPEKELKGFQKVALQPGETTTVLFQLDRRAFAFYDADRREWVVEPGRFTISAGASSRDLRAQATFDYSGLVSGKNQPVRK